MACSTYPAPIDYFLNWEFMDGVVCFYGDQIGVAAFMLVFFGATFLTLYQSSGSVMLPLAVLVVLAPIIAVMLPAIGVQFITVIVLLMVATGGYYVYRRAGVGP